jgi:hypothetical protein
VSDSIPRASENQPETSHDARPADQPTQGQSNAQPLPNGTPLDDYARPPAEPPRANVPDPVEALDAYKSQGQLGAGAVRKPPSKVTALMERKPSSEEFIRVKPGEERFYRLFKMKRADRKYLFRPAVEPYLPARQIRAYRLVLAMPLCAVTPFVWAMPVPMDDLGYSWHASWDALSRKAETTWIKITADMGGGCYIDEEPEETPPEPVWPTQTFDELILLAFRNGRIDDLGHPVFKIIRGAT